MRTTRKSAIFAALLFPGAGLLTIAACSAKQDPAPGAVMVSIDSNLRVPDDIDSIGLEVNLAVDGGKIWEDQIFPLAPSGTAVFPATFAIVHGTDEPVSIKLVGYKGDVAFSIHESITTIPPDRTSLLRMFVDYLDIGSVTNPKSSDVGSVASICKPGTTPTAGTCEVIGFDVLEQEVDGGLPTFNQADIQPSTDGTQTCFDVDTCFKGFSDLRNAMDVTPRPTVDAANTCHIPQPVGGAATLNIGLRQATPDKGGKGWCDGAGCIVPLARDQYLGWHVDQAGLIQLPPAVCTNADILGVVLINEAAATDDQGRMVSCAQKTPRVPACQSNTPNTDMSGLANDGGVVPNDAPTTTITDAGSDANTFDPPKSIAGPGSPTAPIAALAADDTYVYALSYNNDGGGDGDITLFNLDLEQKQSPQLLHGMPTMLSPGQPRVAGSFPWLAIGGQMDIEVYQFSASPNFILGAVHSLGSCEPTDVLVQPGADGAVVVSASACAGKFEYCTLDPTSGACASAASSFDGTASGFNPADQKYIVFDSNTLKYGTLNLNGALANAQTLATMVTLTPTDFAFTSALAVWNDFTGTKYAALSPGDAGAQAVVNGGPGNTPGALAAVDEIIFTLVNGKVFAAKATGTTVAPAAQVSGWSSDGTVVTMTTHGHDLYWVDSTNTLFRRDVRSLF